MNIGIITKPNPKGQIVIPKKYREELGINEKIALNITLQGKGIFIAPISDTLSSKDGRKLFLEILRKTAGSWADNSWPQTQKRRRKIELEASKRRKKAW